MRTKPLGRTGLAVSEYGLGTWAMGGGVYGTADDAESIRTIHRAQELGVNFLDSAPMYGIGDRQDGRAERVVGQAIQGRRDQWILATKFGRHLNGNPEWWKMNEDYSGAQAVRSVEQSLQRMQTDHIDVLFVHSPPSQLFDPDDAFSAMQKLKEQGKIRVIGFSFWEKISDTLPRVEPFLKSGTLEAVQVKVSLLIPDAVTALFPLLRETGTAVVAREALAQGFLTDSFGPDGPFGPEDFKAAMPRDDVARRLDKANQFRFLIDAARGLRSLPEAALNWVVSHPEVSTVIPGSKSVAEIEQCLAAASAKPCDAETLQKVHAIQTAWRD